MTEANGLGGYSSRQEVVKDAHAGVCDKDVEGPKLIDRCLDQAIRSVRLSDVAADSNQFCIAWEVGLEAFEQVGGFGVAQVIHSDFGALPQILDGNCSPNTRDAACDCTYFSREDIQARVRCHGCRRSIWSQSPSWSHQCLGGEPDRGL